MLVLHFLESDTQLIYKGTAADDKPALSALAEFLAIFLFLLPSLLCLHA